nr:hypothetical protein [Legionellales bacterium]
MATVQIIPLEQLGMQDLQQVGGKNASLGEMISQLSGAGVRVPGGFATTADAFQTFLAQKGLRDKIFNALNDLDVDDVTALTRTGSQIRRWIIDTPWVPEFEQAVRAAYQVLVDETGEELSVAVRSSATAEDLPDASFAGQQETFLNVRGIEAVLTSIKAVFASLFNDRAIAYRVHQGFAHDQVSLSAGIQRIVKSASASAHATMPGFATSASKPNGTRSLITALAALIR